MLQASKLLPLARLIPVGALSLTLFAQSSDLRDPRIEEQPQIIGKGGVIEVVVPVTVHDRDGNTVNGVQPREFHLTDNGKEQNINVDITYHPISLVILIQANGAIDAILPQVKKIGSLLENLVAGDQGEVAVAAFDHRFQLKQDFTTDLPKLSESLKKISAGSSTSALIDSMGQGVRLLRHRPANRRRVMLVIAETRDYGSEGKMRNVLLDAQFSNVIVYTVNMSRMIATITNKPYPGPGPLAGLPPATYSMPSNVPATPTTVLQKGVLPGSSADVVPLLVEILRDVKSIFVDNPATVFSRVLAHFLCKLNMY